MLDMHPPHQSIHTWRDFFIHIATIVVGLCIAVGLEQTVEFFHHRNKCRKSGNHFGSSGRSMPIAFPLQPKSSIGSFPSFRETSRSSNTC
jgi:hypothetical protein